MEKIKQDWWMPIKGGKDIWNADGLNFLCDHMGDAQENMEAMWRQICKDHPELPKDGFDNNDDL